MMNDEVRTNGLQFIVHRSYFIVSPLCASVVNPTPATLKLTLNPLVHFV
jgi:hypothetical protein